MDQRSQRSRAGSCAACSARGTPQLSESARYASPHVLEHERTDQEAFSLEHGERWRHQFTSEGQAGWDGRPAIRWDGGAYGSGTWCHTPGGYTLPTPANHLALIRKD